MYCFSNRLRTSVHICTWPTWLLYFSLCFVLSLLELACTMRSTCVRYAGVFEVRAHLVWHEVGGVFGIEEFEREGLEENVLF